MLEYSMFIETLRKRLNERREKHIKRMLSALEQKEYHALCGRVAEIDDLKDTITSLVKQIHEDDDPDPLTKTKSR